MLSQRLNTLSALVLSPSENDQNLLSRVKNGRKSLVSALAKRKKVTFDQFQEGKKFDSFDYVIIAILGDTDADDIESQEDFYKYYGAAPVCAWVINESL